MTFRQQIKRFLRKAVRTSRIAFYRGLSDNTPVSRDVKLVQPMLCTGKGSIRLTGCHIGTQPSPRLWDGYVHMEAREATAAIDIAPNVWLNNSAVLIAERTRISIASGCLIGPAVQIFDSDFHRLEPELRTSGSHLCAPVVLEENVFVGASVIILKGVTIGRNSVIAAGSVVARSVPANSIAGGAPARVLGPVPGAPH